MGEVINFLALSKLVEKEFVFKMHQGLSSGNSLSEILDSLSFSKNVVTQLALAFLALPRILEMTVDQPLIIAMKSTKALGINNKGTRPQGKKH